MPSVSTGGSESLINFLEETDSVADGIVDKDIKPSLLDSVVGDERSRKAATRATTGGAGATGGAMAEGAAADKAAARATAS